MQGRENPTITHGLNRDWIKYLAAVTMMINHFANSFIQKPTGLYYVMTCIGYFTAPVMCYFLVEGFYHTRSLKKYALRLFGFALISQIPYQMAFAKKEPFEFRNFNMLFTLLICLEILTAMHRVETEAERFVIVFFLIAASLGCDWALSAPIFVILFDWFRGSRTRMLIGFGLAALEEGFLYALSINVENNLTTGGMFLWGLAGCAGTLAAGLIIIFFYNGEKAKRGKNFNRWFFYVFYPLHLFIFGIIRMIIGK